MIFENSEASKRKVIFLIQEENNNLTISMGYSFEQQQAYASMEWTWGEFDKIKEGLKISKCPVHQKRAWAGVEWERNYELDVSIYRYCCMEFAEEIKKVFVDRGIFDSVRIDPYEPKKKAKS